MKKIVYVRKEQFMENNCEDERGVELTCEIQEREHFSVDNVLHVLKYNLFYMAYAETLNLNPCRSCLLNAYYALGLLALPYQK